MAQTSGLKTYNTFVRGIITEAGPLTFPENASIDEDNFILNHDGSRQRRLGIDFEDNYQLFDTGVTISDASDFAISAHHWKNVADDANISFSVVQFGSILYIFDAAKIDITNNFVGSIDFSSHKSPYSSTIGQARIQTTSGSGIFVVTSKEINPFYISYNVTTKSFSTTTISIQIRDFFGVEDGLATAIRPTSLSVEHNYNLLNQGWPVSTYCGHINEAGTVVSTINDHNPITQTYTTLSKYPSNADIISVARRDTTAGSNTYIRYYEPDLLTKFDVGNSPAPKGHFIIDAFDRSTSRNLQSSLSLSGSDYETGRPQTTAFFAGRIFYSGIESNSVTTGVHKKVSYSGFIFFSKIIQSLSDVGVCHQEADTTSEDISDILATDGGTIHIPEAGRILHLIPRQNSLVVIADNGVWTITGGELGFRATEFQVLKITNIGAISANSIIDAEGNIVFWGEGGIYALSADQVSLQLTVVNLSEDSIKTLYNNISNTAKIYCASTFNASNRHLRWLYNDTSEYDGKSYRQRYNRELIYDAYLKSFYTNTIDINDVYVSGYVETTLYKSETDTQNIAVGGTQVVVGLDNVLITKQLIIGDRIKTKYLTLIEDTNIFGTISEFSSDSFMDWKTHDGVGQNYSSYLVTGYDTAGEPALKKQTPYLLTYFKRTEDGFDANGNALHPSSCFIQSQWNWSDSVNSGQWGTTFQAYRLLRNFIIAGPSASFDYGYSTIVTKNKLRGSGHTLSLLISSEQGKELHIYGWSLLYSGRTNV